MQSAEPGYPRLTAGRDVSSSPSAGTVAVAPVGWLGALQSTHTNTLSGEDPHLVEELWTVG